MFSINNLNVSYEKNIVIQGLDLNLPLYQIHGLVGLNGSGKTTLLKTISGQKKYDTGNIQILGVPINYSQIAYFETENYFYPRINGQEYLELFRLRKPDFDFETANQLFRLPLKALIETYSTGMKKKLALMGFLTNSSELYLFDEPFNGIDMESVQIIKNIVNKLVDKGKTIILTSHVLESLTSICHTISYLSNKKIQFTYLKNEFNDIEKKIFKNFDLTNNKLIENLV